jgi:hypothetical protein
VDSISAVPSLATQPWFLLAVVERKRREIVIYAKAPFHRTPNVSFSLQISLENLFWCSFWTFFLSLWIKMGNF